MITQMKDKISSPMTNGAMGTPSKKGEGVYNHHTTPALSKPREGGASLPLKFFSGMKGTPEKIQSPMADALGFHNAPQKKG